MVCRCAEFIQEPWLNRKIDEREVLRLLSGMSRLFQGCLEEPDILDVAWWYFPAIFKQYGKKPYPGIC